MLRVTDQYFWSFVFVSFFTILVVMGAIILETEARIPLGALSLTDFALIALASWRLTRLFVYDEMFRFVREQFWDVEKVGKGYQLVRPVVGPRRALADLTDSPWAFGLFATALVTFSYLITSYAVFPVLLLALSAVATFLQLLSMALGRRVE